MANDILSFFPSFISGQRLVDGGDLQQLADLLFSYQTGITALAGGGQVGATVLNNFANRIDTVANANDSVQLPIALPGRWILLYNNTATSAQVFGNPSNPANANAGDTIATSSSNTQQATGTGIALAGAAIAMFYCFTLGQWKEFLTA